MYRGFNIQGRLSDKMITEYHSDGLSLFDNYKNFVLDKFKGFVKNNSIINGSDIEALFFPQIDSNVFISHSHKNEDEIIALAGLLYKKFGIKSFIDSCLWKSAKDLQKILDDEYSWLDPEEKKTYSYDQVSFSASHAHMMLSVALTKMIDQTECMIFYNTPQAILPYKKGSNTTSPWIYSEITTSQVIRKKTPPRRVPQDTRLFSLNESLKNEALIFYQLQLGHLTSVNQSDFDDWTNKKTSSPEDGLDFLYDKFPLKNEKRFV